MHADPPSGHRRNVAVEEHPDVAAVTGSGSFQRGRDAGRVSGVQIGQRIENPALPVEVARKQAAAVAPLERIETGVDVTGEVRLNNVVGVGQVFPIGSASLCPSTSNSRDPAGLARSLVVPAKGVDIVAAGENRTKEGDLQFCRRVTVDGDRRPGRRLGIREQRRPPWSGRLPTGTVIEPEQTSQSSVLRPQRLEFRFHRVRSVVS